jgi:predicted AlkP superfamily phosphohydrolase/phosphomutase
VSSPNLTVIGLDAATFTVIDPLLEAGDLPHLARIFAAGTAGMLRSTTHPLTPQAWTTMVTGVNAGRHGIWDFAERDESGYGLRLVNGGRRRAPAVWDRLTAAGLRSGLVNIPFTWPAPAVDGFSIAGFDSADLEQGMTHPATLLTDLRDRFGAFRLDHKFPLDGDGRVDLDRVRREAEQKVEIAFWLAREFEPELFFSVFMAADHVHHICWNEWEQDGLQSPVADVYRILDESVGALVDAAGPDSNVLVVSDHGGGSLEGVVNLNAWLEQEGYLTYASGGAQARRSLAGKAFALRRHLPHGLRYSLKQRLPRFRTRARTWEEYTIIDWEKTQAFAYGIFGNVVLNVRGREQLGVVEPGEEYERLRDELSERILGLVSPAGTTMVDAVHRREDLFFGPHLDRVPDLLVEFHDYEWLGKGSLKTRGESLWDTIEIEEGSEHSYVGSHRSEGIVALAGPSARRAEGRIAAGIEDIAPTILYLLGQPVPSDLEGRVLTEAIDPSLVDQRPLEYADEQVEIAESEGLEARDLSEVEGRLRSLGYIE